MFKKLNAVVLVLSVVLVLQPAALAGGNNPSPTRRKMQKQAVPWQVFIRTELFFGTAKKDRTEVSESDWRAFIDREVTPKFPDGLTVLTAYGQYLNNESRIEKERSFVLILLYPQKYRRSSSRKIEAIREAYKKAFAQESVLRVDSPIPVRVSF